MLFSAASRKACRHLGLLCLAASAVSPAYASKDSVPDWVRTAAAQSLPIYPPDTRAVVLLDETRLTVGADGNAIEHHRRVIKILRPTGRDEGIVHVDFDKDRKILSLKVWSIGPDGHEYTLKDNEIVELGMPGEGGQLYSDLRFRVAEPPGRDPGGIVAFESDQRAAPYMHEDTWMFQDGLPHLNQSFLLELPAGYTYGTTWAHAEAWKDAQKVQDLEHGKYRWEMNSTPAIDLQRVPLHPSLEALAGRMTVRYGANSGSATPVASWQSIGEWYQPLAQDRVTATPEITAKATQLTAGKIDFYEKAEAIGEYVQQQVRYFVIEMGVGGYIPHAAGAIFKNGYGDCKDKATLLEAMLSSVGIHSAVMWVDTGRGVIDPKAPATFGNHAIGAIEIPAGYTSPKLRSVVTLKNGKRYLIFDPTWEKTPFGQLEDNLQGSYGLLLEGAATEIVELPILSPDLNRITRTASFALASDGTLKGTVVEKRFGDLSEQGRTVSTQGDAKQQQHFLDQRLSQDFTSFDVADVKVENAASLNKDLTTTYALTASRYSRTVGPLLMVRARVLGQDGFALDRQPRRVPIDLGSTRLVQDDFTIELPEGYALDELPESVHVDMDFAKYDSISELNGRTLHYKRTYTVKQVSLPADRYPDMLKLAQVIEGDEQNHAVLKKQ